MAPNKETKKGVYQFIWYTPNSGATGFEPAISALTGQYVNRYTTPPDVQRMLNQAPSDVKGWGG
jgi:hypothetical protein